MHLELDCCVPVSTSPRRVESGNGPSSRILVGPLRIFRRFLIEVEHRPSVAERQRSLPQSVRFPRPQHQQGSRYLAFSREVRYSATGSTQTEGRRRQTLSKVRYSPRAHPRDRGFARSARTKLICSPNITKCSITS